jgi:hypothetical protein
MEVMRHTDMKLTMNLYTDPTLLNTAGAVSALPSLYGPNAQKQKKVARLIPTQVIDCR